MKKIEEKSKLSSLKNNSLEIDNYQKKEKIVLRLLIIGIGLIGLYVVAKVELILLFLMGVSGILQMIFPILGCLSSSQFTPLLSDNPINVYIW